MKLIMGRYKLHTLELHESHIFLSYVEFPRCSHLGKLHVIDSVFSSSIGKLANVMVFSFSVLVK